MSPSQVNLQKVNVTSMPVPDSPFEGEGVGGDDIKGWINQVTKYLKQSERSFTGETLLKILTEENVPDRTKNYFLMYDQSQDQLVFVEDTQ